LNLLTCPRCGGEIIESHGRAWCLKPYDEGGCGAFFIRGRIVEEKPPQQSRRVCARGREPKVDGGSGPVDDGGIGPARDRTKTGPRDTGNTVG
jgi:hypothetical protein